MAPSGPVDGPQVKELHLFDVAWRAEDPQVPSPVSEHAASSTPSTSSAADGALDPRWAEALARVEAEGHRGVLDDAADIARADIARMRLADRLAATDQVCLELEGLQARGAVRRLGSDAIELSGGDGVWLVPLERIVGAWDLPPALEAEHACRFADESMAFASMARAWLGRIVRVERVGAVGVGGVLVASAIDHVEVDCGGRRMAIPLRAVIALRRRRR